MIVESKKILQKVDSLKKLSYLCEEIEREVDEGS